MGKKQMKTVQKTTGGSSPETEHHRQERAMSVQIDARARSRAARNDLDCWLSQFRIGSLEITSVEHCEREISYVRRVVWALGQDDHLGFAREFDRMARAVQEERPFSNYPRELCDKLIDGLFVAAEVERDPLISCPWQECFESISSRPRLLALAKVLWAKNKKGTREWRLDLDALKAEIWGDEYRCTSTVRSLVTEFRKELEKRNVPLVITIHDTYDSHWVRCSLPEDFDFDKSW